MKHNNTKIAMLLSGGVDSSVALAILKEQGHEVHAFYLKIWLEDEMSYLGSCPWEEDLSYAEAVCEKLAVPLTVVPLQKEYHARVVSYTIDAVKKGLTPNPDMHCNTEVKFGAFLDLYGDKYDYVATGHYACIEQSDGHAILRQAPDPVKDQTYFLALLHQEQLMKALFPLGQLDKAQVRELAVQYDLPTANRKDSQGICFLGKISFADFIRHHLGVHTGNFINRDTGEIVGQHEGCYYYTTGQRRGITMEGGPWYVSYKDPQKNIVYVTHGFSPSDYSVREFDVHNLNWISDPSTYAITNLKLRHGPAFHAGKISVVGDSVHVTMTEGDYSVTPGQYAVFYTDDNICVGAGVIGEYNLKSSS